METIKRQTRAAWLQARVHERGLRLRPRLYSGSASDAQRRCSCSMRLVAFAFMPLATATAASVLLLSVPRIQNELINIQRKIHCSNFAPTPILAGTPSRYLSRPLWPTQPCHPSAGRCNDDGFIITGEERASSA